MRKDAASKGSVMPRRSLPTRWQARQPTDSNSFFPASRLPAGGAGYGSAAVAAFATRYATTALASVSLRCFCSGVSSTRTSQTWGMRVGRKPLGSLIQR
jgi:hypothetical protein